MKIISLLVLVLIFGSSANAMRGPAVGVPGDPLPVNTAAELSLLLDEPEEGEPKVDKSCQITPAMKRALEQEANARISFYKNRIQTVQWMLAKSNTRSKFAAVEVKREGDLLNRNAGSLVAYERAQLKLNVAQTNINLWVSKIDEYKDMKKIAEAKLAQVQALATTQ